jgi:predicted Fe-Mo cluster-binding NifX family protein
VNSAAATVRAQVGIRIALARRVLIAIPNFHGRVSPVFDVASRLTVIRVQRRAELGRREVTLLETRPDTIARCLAELGVDLLICGAISQMLESLLRADGLRVVSQVCGEIDSVIQAFLHGRLDAPEYCLPGCFGRRHAPSGPGRPTAPVADRAGKGRSAPSHAKTHRG